MLTTVTLYGPLGKEFGRDWELAVSSPAEAMRMIEANNVNQHANLTTLQRPILTRVKARIS